MHPQPTIPESEVLSPSRPEPEVTRLARAHGRRVFQAAYRVLGDAALAEDIQQEVFLKLLERPRRDVESWPAYLCTMATRLAIDEARRRRRWSRLTPAWLRGLVDPSDSPDTRFAEDRRARDLRSALGCINPREAACFSLRYFQAMSVADTAKALGMTDNHVSVTLHRAVKSLRERLADLETNSKEDRS